MSTILLRASRAAVKLAVRSKVYTMEPVLTEQIPISKDFLFRQVSRCRPLSLSNKQFYFVTAVQLIIKKTSTLD